MTITNLEEFFIHELRETFSAERQLAEALPRMIKAATSHSLRQCLESQLQTADRRIDCLNEVFVSLGEYARGRTSTVVDALIQTAMHLIEKDVSDEADPEVTSSALIAVAQKLTHHGISAYSSLATWAKTLELRTAFVLLQQIVEDERAAAERLIDLARVESEQFVRG